jgi:hypothetical protein
MQTINFNDKNVSVTMTYDDLQRMVKECVITTMREMDNVKKKEENQKWL